MSKAFPWYTARGDDGTTGLLGAGRVPKHHPQPEAFGAVDEAGSMIGFACALIDDREINDLLVQVQRHCYGLMAELAATPDAQAKFRQVGSEQVAWLADITDQFGQRVTMPREFVIPGDTLADAALDMARTAVRERARLAAEAVVLDMARTAVRRAERCASRLVAEDMIENPDLLGYLNRLSSLLFVLGRYMVARTGENPMTFAKRELPE